MKDLYPSRKDGEPALLPRKDPAPWRSFARPWHGPLSEPDLAAFGETGFLVIEGLLDAETVERCRDDADRLIEENAGIDAPEIVREPASERIRSIFALHRGDGALARLARDERIVSRVEQLLDSHAYMHQSRLNLKPAFDGREFDWHSDFETWHVEDGMPRMRAISCAVALTANEAVNGPLLMIPGSHQHFVACAGVTPERHYEVSLRRQEYGVPDRALLSRLAEAGGVFPFTGSPGALVLFDCNVMHASSGNITPLPRNNAFFVYNSVENALQAPYSGQPPRPEHIASRDFSPLQAA